MSAEKALIIGRATAHIGEVRYRVDIESGHHRLTADEAPALGGQDAGPPPFSLLVSALGACTAVTLKMYAEHKGWPLEGLDVDLRFVRSESGDHIERLLTAKGPLDESQRAKLADIAERTPVTLAIKSGVAIHTEMAPAEAGAR